MPPSSGWPGPPPPAFDPDWPGGVAPAWGIGDFLLGMVFMVVGQTLALGLAVGIGDLSVEDLSSGGELPVWAVWVLQIGGWAPVVAWTWIVARQRGLGSLRRDFGLSFERFDVVRALVAGLACVAIGAVVLTGYEAITDVTPEENDQFIPAEGLAALEAVALFGAVAVFTPLVEELVFRGFLLRALHKKWGRVAGLTGSSVVFGLLHLQTDIDGAVATVLVTGLWGLVFALANERCGRRLGPGVLAHMLMNAIGLASRLAA